jgi:hypothetical protein
MRTFPRSLKRSTTASVAGPVLVAALLAAPTTAFATVYGLESTEGSGSAAPTQLFSFEENGSGVTVIADVMVGGEDIDADALAQSPAHGLRAYRLIGTSSQLISINSTTGAATHIGAALANREMRAAAFDALGRLWVVDATNNVLLRIDPATGAVVGSAVPLMLGMSAFTITADGSDIAFAANGTAVLVDSNSVYSLNTATGAVALLFQDSALQTDLSPVFHVGAAFVAGVGGGKLFVFDVNGTDDVFFYQNLSTPRVLYDEDFSSSFNAGRGDLASLPPVVPPGQTRIPLETSCAAPGLGAGYTVTTIAEVPSTSDGGYVVFRVQTDGPGSDDPQAIYRWHPAQVAAAAGTVARGVPACDDSRLVLIARTGQSVTFPGATRTIAFFESPIVDDDGNVAFTATLDVGRGLLVWDSTPGTLIGAVRTGQAVVITCDTIIVTACGDGMVGNTNAGTLTNIAAFTNRVAASFSDGRALFVGAMSVTAGGTAEAVWTWDLATATLTNIANSRQLADGEDDPDPPHPFYQSFPNVASCDGKLLGNVFISQGAPATVYEFNPNGAGHTLLERGYRPELIPRVDFHCSRGNWGYAGTFSNVQGDNAPARRGVWVNTQQVYSFGVTAFPGPGGVATTLGNPLGEALLGASMGDYKTVFASELTGGSANGKSGVFIDGSGIGLAAITYETEPHPAFNLSIEKIYTANVSPRGKVGLFLQKRDSTTMALSDAIAIWDGASVSWLSKVGDQIQVGGQTATITGFRVLGRNFTDTVVTGTGLDGHLNAFNGSDSFVYIVDYTLPAGLSQSSGEGLVPRGGATGAAIVVANTTAPAFATLDVDANGQVLPLSDGLLVLRHLFGFSGATLTNGALGGGCTRCLAADITAYLNGIASQLNIDGNPGAPQALTDGLLVLRFLFGFTGTTLTTGAVGPSCTRCDAASIVPYLNGLQ